MSNSGEVSAVFWCLYPLYACVSLFVCVSLSIGLCLCVTLSPCACFPYQTVFSSWLFRPQISKKIDTFFMCICVSISCSKEARAEGKGLRLDYALVSKTLLQLDDSLSTGLSISPSLHLSVSISPLSCQGWAERKTFLFNPPGKCNFWPMHFGCSERWNDIKKPRFKIQLLFIPMGNQIMKDEMLINSNCHYSNPIAIKTHITGGKFWLMFGHDLD